MKTIYRDDFYRNIVLANILLQNEQTAEQGFDFAVKAFKAYPCRTSILEVLSAIRFSKLRDKAYAQCKEYSEEFEKNKEIYAGQDGYYYKIATAIYAAIYLQEAAQIQHNDDLADFYQLKRTEYGNEVTDIFSKIVW